MAEIRCTYCGWLNDPEARMCGGCGRPLRASLAPVVAPVHARPAAEVTADASSSPADPDAPTVVDVAPIAPPIARPSGRPRSPQAAWNPPLAPERRAQQRGGTLTKVLVALLVALMAVLLVVGLVWDALVRPALHQQVDGALRAQVAAMVATVNREKVIPSATVSFTAAQVTQTLEQQLPSGVPAQNVQVSFNGGRVIITFTTSGFDGSVSTALVAVNGRLKATATEVDGPLALVESGSDLEAAINDSLAKLRTDVSVQSVTLDKDVMTVSVKGNVTIPGQ